jgi:hypothetical protein
MIIIQKYSSVLMNECPFPIVTYGHLDFGWHIS